MSPPSDVTTRSPVIPNQSWPKKAVIARTTRPTEPKTIVKGSLCFRQPMVRAITLTGKINTSMSRWNTCSSRKAPWVIGARVNKNGSARQCSIQMLLRTTATRSSRERFESLGMSSYLHINIAKSEQSSVNCFEIRQTSNEPHIIRSSNQNTGFKSLLTIL
jgi:hypothetical protein